MPTLNSIMRYLKPISFLVVILFAQGTLAFADRHFVEWFPAYAPVFRNITRDNCSLEVGYYWQGRSPNCPSHAEWPQCITGYAIDCIMDKVNEFNKANLAAAGVVLGVLPTILSLAGSSTAESGLLAMRRPLLAALLVAGAPVVSPIRSFDFANPAKIMMDDYREPTLRPTNMTKLWEVMIVCAEYVLAAAATANLILVSYEIGVKGVCSFSTDTIFLPLLWALLAIPIHACGAAAVRLRLQVADSGTMRHEFKICMLQSRTTMQVKKKTILFVVVSWMTSVGTIMHMIFGTLVLSSTMFVATVDALMLAARYLASTIVCRLIVSFEISGMAERVKVVNLPSGVVDGSNLQQHRNDNGPSK